MSSFFARESKLGLMLAPIAIPLGMLISYLLLAAIMGDFGDAFAMIAFSIICTAGISLIIWLPVWYVAGYLVLIAIRFLLKWAEVDTGSIFRSRKKQGSGEAEQNPVKSDRLQSLSGQLDQEVGQQPKLTKDERALINYIQKARSKGLTTAQISTNLAKNGWPGNSINAALQAADGGA